MWDWWQILSDVFREEFAGLADGTRMTRLVLRLLVAAALGAVLGYERGRAGKAVGLRTLMLVTLGAALFILAPQWIGAEPGELCRVVQGVATGMGFLGAGVILKGERSDEVRGLTTAAAIWMATAIGIAVGLGRLDIALCTTILAYFILAFLQRFESSSDKGNSIH